MKILSKITAFLAIYCLLLTSSYAAVENLTFQVSGISDALLLNVNSRLSLLKKSYGNQLTSEQIKLVDNLAMQEILKALEPYGYFKAKVTHHIRHEGKEWTIEFQVNPGPILKISSVDIQIFGPGKENAALQNFIKHFPLKAGDPFQSPDYEKAKEEIFE